MLSLPRGKVETWLLKRNQARDKNWVLYHSHFKNMYPSFHAPQTLIYRLQVKQLNKCNRLFYSPVFPLKLNVIFTLMLLQLNNKVLGALILFLLLLTLVHVIWSLIQQVECSIWWEAEFTYRCFSLCRLKWIWCITCIWIQKNKFVGSCRKLKWRFFSYSAQRSPRFSYSLYE